MKITNSILASLLLLASYQISAQQLYPFRDSKPKPVKESAFLQHLRDLKDKQNNDQSGRTESIEIVGGQPIDIAEVPWQVALMVKDQGFQFCGGSIIDEYWILTAAHCLEGAMPNQIQVLAGSSSVVDINGGQLVDVAEIIMHPNYFDVGTGYDIALLRLSSPLDLSGNSARKIPYASPLDEQNGLTNEGVLSLISGWGTLSEGGLSPDVLYGANVPIVSNETANALDYQGLVTETMLAAGDIENGGIDACQGDSGGPLVVPNSAGSGYVLAGITSWGYGCANASSPGLYARVAFFADWIEENSGVSNNEFPQLIISEVVQGNEEGNLPNYIEIYNASSEPYNLAEVVITIVAENGSNATIELPESELAAGEVFLVSSSEFQSDWGGSFVSATPDIISDELNLNGNLIINLTHATQFYTIDQYGSDRVDNEIWQYNGKIVERNSFVVFANSGNFSLQNFPEWSKVDYNSQNASPGSHEASLPENDASLISFTVQNNQKFILCSDSFDLEAKMNIRNSGSSAIESIEFSVKVGDEIFEISKDLSDEPVTIGTSRQIELPVLIFNNFGNYILSVEINKVNGVVDGNPINNQRGVSFRLVEGFKTTFDILFDRNAHENAFAILDSLENNLVHFGNGGDFFEGYNKNETYTEEVCLEAGFYSFVFVDDEGAGLISPAKASFTINSNEFGDIKVAEISGAFHDELLFYPFKLPYDEVLDAKLKFISPKSNDLSYSCDLDISIKIQVVNVNSLPITDFVLSYGEIDQEELTYSYGGDPLLSGEGIDLSLTFPLTANGSASVFATITEVNGGLDNTTENNSETISFTNVILENPNELTLAFFLDSWPDEASWEIVNETGQVVNSGFFSEVDAESTVFVSICLPDGTYSFTIKDSFGDGGTGMIASNENQDILFVIEPDFFSASSYTFSLPYDITLDALISVESPLSGEDLPTCNTNLSKQVIWSFENISNVPVYEFEMAFEFGDTSGVYQFLSGQNDQFLILPDQKVLFALDLNLAEGANVINSSITRVNEVELNIPAESHTFNVLLDSSLHPVNVNLKTDSWPEETSFMIISAINEELIANVYGFPENSTVNYDYCLVDGSYTFKLMDNFGDGGASASLKHTSTGFSFGNIAGDSYADIANKAFCIGCVNPPTNLHLSEVSLESLGLAWDDNATNESGFILYRSFDGILWVERHQLPSNSTSFVDLNLQPSTDYWYGLMAVDNFDNGISGFGNVLQGRTEDPLGLSQKELTALYPNPVKSGDQLYIDFAKLPSNGRAVIVDASGRQVIKVQQSSEVLHRVNTYGWKPGIYFFRYESAEKSLSIPFILMD